MEKRHYYIQKYGRMYWLMYRDVVNGKKTYTKFRPVATRYDEAVKSARAWNKK